MFFFLVLAHAGFSHAGFCRSKLRTRRIFLQHAGFLENPLFVQKICLVLTLFYFVCLFLLFVSFIFVCTFFVFHLFRLFSHSRLPPYLLLNSGHSVNTRTIRLKQFSIQSSNLTIASTDKYYWAPQARFFFFCKNKL